MAMTSVLKILGALRGGSAMMRSIGEIELWRESNGELFYRVGNSVVLFKVRYGGEWRAMRCYVKSVANLYEIYGDRYFAEELYVHSNTKSELWIDVVLEEWVEGVTLKEAVECAIEEGATKRLLLLADGFDRLAYELLNSDTAHGDLTAENIMVTNDMQLRLIDFDCKFLPQFAGQAAPELGTASYQPPSRRSLDFDRDIDDFSIALISTALRALTLNPALYHKYHFYDGLIFNPALIVKGKCQALDECIELFLNNNMAMAYRVAMLLTKGVLRISPLREIFSPIDCCGEELQLMERCGCVGYATSEIVVVIPAIYDDGLSFNEGVAMVKLRDKWLAIDTQNRVIMSFEGCERVKSFRGGVAHVLRGGVWIDILR